MIILLLLHNIFILLFHITVMYQFTSLLWTVSKKKLECVATIYAFYKIGVV